MKADSRSSPPSHLSDFSQSRIASTLLALVTAACLAISVRASLLDRFANDRRARELKLYASLDYVFERLAQERTPVFLKFPPLTGSDDGFASTIYFRAVFTAFPIPILVVDPSIPIFFADDILRANIERDDDRLAAHGVGIVLNIRFQNGTFLMTTRRVNPLNPGTIPPSGIRP